MVPKAQSMEQQKKMIQNIMESDSEDEEASPSVLADRNNTGSRLSQLSKLNLLGLIDLALVACSLKLFKGVDIAIKLCEQSILLLKSINLDTGIEAGIASQNLIEELIENLLRIKDRELEVIDEEEALETTGNGNSPPSKSIKNNISQAQDALQMQYLQQVKKGNKITQSKEFKLVFFITCFVPFIRPNVPMIKP